MVRKICKKYAGNLINYFQYEILKNSYLKGKIMEYWLSYYDNQKLDFQKQVNKYKVSSACEGYAKKVFEAKPSLKEKVLAEIVEEDLELEEPKFYDKHKSLTQVLAVSLILLMLIPLLIFMIPEVNASYSERRGGLIATGFTVADEIKDYTSKGAGLAFDVLNSSFKFLRSFSPTGFAITTGLGNGSSTNYKLTSAGIGSIGDSGSSSSYNVNVSGDAAWETVMGDGSSSGYVVHLGYLTMDVASPTVNLELPEDNATNITTNTIDFTYNVTDDSTLANCALIIENSGGTSINVTDTEMLKDAAGQNLTTYLTNGEYNWSVNCTDSNDYVGASEIRNVSINFVPENLPPETVTLVEPFNGNATLFNKTITFQWLNTTDPEGSALKYNIQVKQCNVGDPSTCNPDAVDFTSPFTKEGEINVTDIAEGTNLTAYISMVEVKADQNYTWRVRAYDGTDYGGWSENWTFYAPSTVMFTIFDENMRFGSMNPNEANDTTDNSPYPFRIRNDGNVLTDFNITVDTAEDWMWDRYQEASQYFRYCIDNATAYSIYAEENASFNWSDSATTPGWFNIPETNTSANIRQLNYSDITDEVEIDVRIQVPSDEPAGDKGSAVRITGWVSA